MPIDLGLYASPDWNIRMRAAHSHGRYTLIARAYGVSAPAMRAGEPLFRHVIGFIELAILSPRALPMRWRFGRRLCDTSFLSARIGLHVSAKRLFRRAQEKRPMALGAMIRFFRRSRLVSAAAFHAPRYAIRPTARGLYRQHFCLLTLPYVWGWRA